MSYISRPKKSMHKHVEIEEDKDQSRKLKHAELINRLDMGRKMKSPCKNITIVPFS